MAESGIRSFQAAKREEGDGVEPFEVIDRHGKSHEFVADLNVGNTKMLDFMEGGLSLEAMPAILQIMLGSEDEYERFKSLDMEFDVTKDVIGFLSEELVGTLGN